MINKKKYQSCSRTGDVKIERQARGPIENDYKSTGFGKKVKLASQREQDWAWNPKVQQ